MGGEAVKPAREILAVWSRIAARGFHRDRIHVRLRREGRGLFTVTIYFHPVVGPWLKSQKLYQRRNVATMFAALGDAHARSAIERDAWQAVAGIQELAEKTPPASP